MRIRFLLPAAAMSAALSACSLAPPLVKPAAPIAPAYAQDVQLPGQSAAGLGWRQMMSDARLQRLIELALENNRDLRIAALNVGAVRAQYQIQDSKRFPGVAANGGGARQGGMSAQGSAPAPAAYVQTQFTAGVAMSAFEIDLFGRLRSLSAAAFARYLATLEGQRAARISLLAAVADAYLEERHYWEGERSRICG